MDLTSSILNSDNESDTDVLDLDTDYDFPIVEDLPATSTKYNSIGSVWRDMVVEEQMEGSLTHLEVTTKSETYTDIDNPNYKDRANNLKRKRVFSSDKSNQNTENISKKDFDLEANHVVKKRYSRGNGDFTKCNYKYANTKEFIEKRDNKGSSLGRILPTIDDIHLMTTNELVDILCKNLHEHNKDLMLSVISNIDKTIITEKYNKTCLIESMGGQMIKNGNRRRTSGGIFLNLIKQDKSISNSAKKSLFGCSQNEAIKKRKKKEKMKRRKEKLKKIVEMDKKEADNLITINEELENKLSKTVSENYELSDDIQF